MKRIRGLIKRMRLLSRLHAAETVSVHAAKQLDEIARALQGIRVCIDCGAVQLMSHPKVGATEVSEGVIEIRCQFHQDVFSRSPKGKIVVPGSAPKVERTRNLRVV